MEKTGYVVMCVPPSGIFVKRGKLMSGTDEAIKVETMPIHASEAKAKQWMRLIKRDHPLWKFVIVTVRYREIV